MLSHEQIKQIDDLLREVGKFQIREQAKLGSIQIEEKSLNQLVSYVDIESEKMLVKGLLEITPGSSFVTEEDTTSKELSTNQWIIDPIDGTTNYLFNHQLYSISIAYQVKEETVYGAVYLPALNDMYVGTPKGSTKNNNSINVSNRNHLADTLIATGFPYYNFEELEQYISILKNLMKNTKGLRRMGSAAIDLAYTAEGRFDGFFELNLNSWDIAAGAYIIQQAGGMVCDFKGGNGYGNGKQIIAANKEVAELLLSEINAAGLH